MPIPSLFRPARGINQDLLQDVLDDNRKLAAAIDRRGALRGALSLGMLTMLTGCDVTDAGAVQKALNAISSFNDRFQAWLFDPNRLAPTFTEADVVNPPRYNAFYDVEFVKPISSASWKLELAGKIGDKRPVTLPQILALPEQEMIVRHICVEGWDYIGQWSGVNLRSFLEKVGADLTAKFVAFRCGDGYGSTIDMPTALHPQTILATKYARQPITDPFGAPLRLRTAVKLGFKNPKWITGIEVTDQNRGGYWEDRGYNWYSGL